MEGIFFMPPSLKLVGDYLGKTAVSLCTGTIIRTYKQDMILFILLRLLTTCCSRAIVPLQHRVDNLEITLRMLW